LSDKELVFPDRFEENTENDFVSSGVKEGGGWGASVGSIQGKQNTQVWAACRGNKQNT
jgi:hypothetical protein